MATGAYAALVEKVDAFAKSAHNGQAEFLRCGYGCDGCCRVRRSATRVEIAHIQAHLSGYPADRRAALARRRARLDATGEARCVFLDDDGGCAVYAARPLICRTHGPAVRLPDGELAWCALNFSDQEPQDVEALLDPSTVLDVNLLNHTLAVVNAQHIARTRETPRAPLAAALDPPCR
jgi:hypothetical protein